MSSRLPVITGRISLGLVAASCAFVLQTAPVAAQGAAVQTGAEIAGEQNVLSLRSQQTRDPFDISGSGLARGDGFGDGLFPVAGFRAAGTNAQSGQSAEGAARVSLDPALFANRADPNAHSRWYAWAGGDVTFFDTDADREGAVAGFTAGMAYRPTERLSGALFASFRHDGFDSNNAGLESDVNNFGAGLLVDYLGPAEIRGQAVLRVGFGVGESSSGTASGDFDQRELGVGLRVNRQIGLGGGYYIDPNAQVTYQLTDREDYTLTDGTFVPGDVTDSANLRLGASIGQGARFLDGALSQLDWQIRAGAVVNFLGDPDFAAGAVDETDFGGTVGSSLRFTFHDDMVLGINADYLHLGGDLDAISAGLDLEIPFD